MARFKEKEQAFKSNVSQGVIRAIHHFAQMQYKLYKHDFQPSELLRLFVAPERRELLHDSYEIAAPRGFISELYVQLPVDTSYGVPHVDLRFQWSSRDVPDAFLVPNDMGASVIRPVPGLQPDCPDELRKLFMRTFNDMVDIAFKFGQCVWVYEQLNNPNVCRTPAQLRYYWPAILPLLRKAGYHIMAQPIAEPNARAGASVNLPHDVAAVLKETNETLARAHFIEPEQANAKKFKLNYELMQVLFREKFAGVV